MEDMQVTQIPVSDIYVGQNIRFGLKKPRISALAGKIAEAGEIHTPLWVGVLPEAVEGKNYQLYAGNYRLAAAEELGLAAVPAIIRETPPTAVDLIKLQFSENHDREGNSPMDDAHAAKAMLDAGMSRQEVCLMFSRDGGRKGKKVQPASYSWLAMHLEFLKFPKAIQQKIHDGPDGGGITVSTALALARTVDPAKWEVVLKRAEEDRQKELEQENKWEEAYQAAQVKAEEAEKKRLATVAELEKTTAEFEEASKAADAGNQAAIDLFTQSKAAADKEAKTALETKLREAEKLAKENLKKATDLKKAKERLEAKVNTVTQTATAEKTAATDAKPGGKSKAAGAPTPANIGKAAKELEASTNFVALKAPEMKKAVEEWAMLPGVPEKVQLIGKIVKKVFDGIITPDQGQWEMAYVVTGEKKERPKHMGPAPKPPKPVAAKPTVAAK